MKARKPIVRRKKSAAARLRPFWIVAGIVVAAGACAAYYGSQSPVFDPRSIRVEGNETVATSRIVERANISRSENVWLQNMGAASRRIASIPNIATVRIRRRLPAQVTVAVTERIPYAGVSNGNEAAVVDKRLRVLSAETPSAAIPAFTLPGVRIPGPGGFLTAAAARRMRDDYDRLRGTHMSVEALWYDRFGNLAAKSGRGITVLFGDDTALKAALPLVRPILEQLAGKGRPVKAIDLRAPGTPVVVYR